MLPHQQRARELATANTFSFSSSSLSPSDEMEYDTWAERIKGQYNHFGKPSDAKPGAWTRRIRDRNPDEANESGTPSPELWKKPESPVIRSAESSPVRSVGYYNDKDNRFSHISHGARAQTIAKYRQEMLDLVKGMPETAYELSLRDIVESPKITTPLKESTAGDDGGKSKKKVAKTMSRSESMETGGLMLKMFIPRIPGVLKGRKSVDTKDTPKLGVAEKSAVDTKDTPKLGDAEKTESEKSADREWWSAEFEPMNSSSGSSSSSNSSGRRRSR